MATPVAPFKADIFEEDISYRSAVSEELLRKIAASVNAINRDALLPLGTMVSSFLPQAQFQVLTSTAWVLCAGQNITDTHYGQFLISQGLTTGAVFLPDSRGMALIGANNGRADGNHVHAGLVPGQFLAGGVKDHTHTYQSTTRGFAPPGTGTGSVGTLNTQPVATTSGASSGQSQNTVNSIGVNYFIKVWNVAT